MQYSFISSTHKNDFRIIRGPSKPCNALRVYLYIFAELAEHCNYSWKIINGISLERTLHTFLILENPEITDCAQYEEKGTVGGVLKAAKPFQKF